MNRRERVMIGILGILTVGSFVYGSRQLFIQGPLKTYLERPETWRMAAELFLFLVWGFWCVYQLKRQVIQIGGIAAAVFLFTWCHQAFLPLLVSGLYALYLLSLGSYVRYYLDNHHDNTPMRPPVEKGAIDFLIGTAVWISAVCLLSAIGQGGIPQLRILACITAAPLYIWKLFHIRHDRKICNQPTCRNKPDTRQSVCMLLILTMVILQIGRMNIAIDYDSLHYGLRTPFILNNGSGIYENLGNINLVYTYSKGLECLVMPLSGSATYGFVLAFNIWVTVAVLLLAYEITRTLAGATYGILSALILSFIPGIMNMAITAKSDNITLLFQLCFILFTIRLLQSKRHEEKTTYLILSGCACLLTFVFKPTALVFSTVVYGMGLVFLLVTRQVRLKVRCRWWLAVLPVSAAWLGMWARTLILTGVPVTSVFTSVFGLVGFKVKPPFAFASIPDNGGELGFQEGLRHLLNRLWFMLEAPIGKDMDHVIIAWGTPLIGILIVILCLTVGTAGSSVDCIEKRIRSYLYTIFLPLSVVCLISIRMLWQVDGNYFILFYSLLTILAVLAVSRCGLQGFKRNLIWILVPFMLFNAGVTCVTNWAGISGFSPPKLLHSGYYNHEEEARIQKVLSGNEAIWNMLAINPKTRVIAIGSHPEVLTFPCNIQSYYDVTGSGGNVVLVKTLDNFKSFLSYAKTDYLYVQAGYMEKGSRVWDIVVYMIEDGSLTDIRYEYGNMIATVNLDERLAAAPLSSLQTFDQLYIPSNPKISETKENIRWN